MMKPRPSHRAWRTIAAVILAIGAVPMSAHVVIVEQVVAVTIERAADLQVHLRVPAAVTGDPTLPGLLTSGPPADLDRQLRVVAADIARNLDPQVGETALPMSAASARRVDATSIDVDVRYSTAADDGDLSVRLNAFTAKDGLVRTNARYRRGSGREQLLSITGPATRVVLDPPLLSVLRDFAVRGLRALFDSGDHLLFLLCLVLPPRRPTSLVALYAAAAAAQALAIAGAAAGPSIVEPWVSMAAMAAASTVVVAAVQNIADARMRWVLPLAVLFGALNAGAFSQAAQTSIQLAGAHRLVAWLVFTTVVLTGELWLGAVAWAGRAWLRERGLSDRIAVWLGSALIAHSAIHRAVERAQLIADTGSAGGERVLLWLALLWIAAALVAAAASAISRPSPADA